MKTNLKILPEKWKIKRNENSEEINQILSLFREEPYYTGKDDYIYYKILPEKWKIKRNENSEEINQILSSLRTEPYYAGKNDYIYFHKDVFAFTRTIDNNDEYLELSLSNLKEIL